MPRWLFQLLGLKADEHGAMTITKTRTTTRTAVTVGLISAGLVAAAAFTMITQLRQETPTSNPETVTVATSIAAQVGTVNGNTNAGSASVTTIPTGCVIRVTKDGSSPTVIAKSTDARIAIFRLANIGTTACDLGSVQFNGLLTLNAETTARNRTLRLTEVRGSTATLRGDDATGDARTVPLGNQAPFRINASKHVTKLAIPAGGYVLWRVSTDTNALRGVRTIDVTFSNITATGVFDLQGEPVTAKQVTS